MAEILMPKLSDSMEEGTIVRWLVADGAEVRRGEELAEIETDKATMTYEAEAAGTLRIVAPEGGTIAIGDVIARSGGAGDVLEEPAGRQRIAATAGVAAPATPAVSPNGRADGGPARAKASPLA